MTFTKKTCISAERCWIREEATVARCDGDEPGEEMPGWTALIEAWNERSDDIQVKLERIPGGWEEYVEKTMIASAVNDPYDLGRTGIAYMPSFIEKDMLLDLMPFADADGFDLSLYFPGAIDPYVQDGHFWGVPVGVYALHGVINPQLFNHAGLSLPALNWEESWTWSEFRTAMRRLTQGEGSAKQYGAWIGPAVERVVPYLLQNGVNWLTPDKARSAADDPRFIETLSFLHGMMHEQQAVLPGWDNLSAFSSGRLAFFGDGTWMLPWLQGLDQETWRFVPYPRGNAGAGTVNFVDGYTIFSGTRHSAEAWEVVKFLGSAEAENILIEHNLGGIPALVNVARDRLGAGLFDGVPIDQQQVLVDAAAFSQSLPYTANWTEVANVANEVIWKVQQNETSPELAAQEIVERTNALLAQP